MRSSRNRVLPGLLAVAALGCITLVLTTCGTSQNTTPVTPNIGNVNAPALSELSDILAAELKRLGKDIDRTTAAAPTGSNNAVFDLSAEIVGSSEASGFDPGSGRAPYRPVYAAGNEDGLVQGTAPTQMGGTGGSPVFIKQTSAITGIELAWTERIVGDYDQNGEVNPADLTPLALNWQATVNYDAPALHGGFAGWPTGDPDGAGAANWLIARVDGDSNGEVSNSDITSIALHFQERIDGYRVYRKAPGETGFAMLPPPAPVEADITLAHPASPGNAPVRYSLNDGEATPDGLGDGVYQYYVAGYDKVSGAESPASGIVHVNLVTGTVNQSPVAQLSISPGFAGAPAEITLDASRSYDPDGTVAAYEWDFDADGVVDWLSTDPMPDESSGGTVDSIVDLGAGRVQAEYQQADADWFYPTVSVVDDLDAQSVPADARLGLSGWVIAETINPEDGLQFDMMERHTIKVDPATDEIVLFGSSRAAFEEGPPKGVYTFRRHGPGDYEVEMIADWYDSVIEESTNQLYAGLHGELEFTENGSPIAFLRSGLTMGTTTQMYVADRRSGAWKLRHLYDTSEGSSYSSLLEVQRSGPETFAIYTWEKLSAPGNRNRRVVLHYDYNDMSLVLDDPQIDWGLDDDPKKSPAGFDANPSGAVAIYYGYRDTQLDPEFDTGLLTRISNNNWKDEFISESFGDLRDGLGLLSMVLLDGDQPTFVGRYYSDRWNVTYTSTLYIVGNVNGNFEIIPVGLNFELGLPVGLQGRLIETSQGLGIAYGTGYDNAPDGLSDLHSFTLVETNGNQVQEDIFSFAGASGDYAYLGHDDGEGNFAQLSDGTIYILGKVFIDDGRRFIFHLITRVDPRLGK